MRATFGIFVLLFAGCTDFDREDRIEDLRILAVRTEPAEVFYDPLHAFSRPEERPPELVLPTHEVRVEVFAFEPRGGLVKAALRLCPDGTFACLDLSPEEIVAAFPRGARDELLAVYGWHKADAELDPGGQRPSGRVPGLAFDFAFTPAVVDSIVPKAEDGTPIPSFFSQLPRFVVEVESPEHAEVMREIAMKRIPFTLDVWHESIPPRFRSALEGVLGVKLCEERVPDEVYREGPTDCVEPRGPNKNPPLLGFDLDEKPPDPHEGVRVHGQPMIGRQSLLSVARGDLFRLTPVFAEGAEERYQVLVYDMETSEITIENRYEDLACSWYTTRGDVSLGLTSVHTNGRLGVSWQLPFEGVFPGERDSLVLVVRDQRGGTAVAEVVVEYR